MGEASKIKPRKKPDFLKRKRALSSTMAINELIGGYVSKTPVGGFGKPQSGKTILFGIQEPWFIAKQIEKGILYIDTEGGSDLIWDNWWDVFAERFDYEPEISFHDLRDIVDILDFHGYNIDTKTSSKGKMDIVYLGKDKAMIDKVIKKNNIGILVYDSITRPIAVPGGRVNFSARTDLIDMWMGAMHQAAIEHDLFVFATHHGTQDPAQQWKRPDIKGGKNVLHNFKIHFYLQQRGFSKHEHVRDVYLTRYGNRPSWKDVEQVVYTDSGVIDITPEELASMAKVRKKSSTEEDGEEFTETE